MLMDIRKAFLMIRQDPEKHKNRFCILLKAGNELICFQYTTLIFGFNASTFIPNFILKHQAERFPTDSCTEITLSNLYVDTIVILLKNLFRYIPKL